MSKEIVEAVQTLEKEKGISAEKLMLALEDALLSAYKKTPAPPSTRAWTWIARPADFRVFELIVPPELEEKLVKEAIEEERTIDPETGELREPEEPEIDLEKLAEYEDQIASRDVTPTDFGRIAAQTAKQVILQRIREAERDMMFEEYQDRVGRDDHRDHPAVRLALHARAAARARRGAAARSPSRSTTSATTTACA